MKVELLEASFFFHQKETKCRRDLHEIFLKPQYTCVEVPQFSISTFNTPFFCFLFLFEYTQNLQPGSSKQQTKMVSIAKIFLQDYPERFILSYFLELLKALSPSRMLLLFSLTFSLSWLGKNINIYGADIPRRCIESRHFYPCPPPQLKFTPKFF